MCLKGRYVSQSCLCVGHDVIEDFCPFPAGEPGRIFPVLQVRYARHVGPGMVAMRGDVEFFAAMPEILGVMRSEHEALYGGCCVRSSGTRLSGAC